MFILLNENFSKFLLIDEKEMKFCYFPFSVGPRDCTGRNLALLEADLISVLIIQRYFIKFPKDIDHSKVRMIIHLLLN